MGLMLFLLCTLFVFVFIGLPVFLVNEFEKKWYEGLFLFFYLLSSCLCLLFLLMYNLDYTEPINLNVGDEGYTAFASEHLLSLVFYWLAFHYSAFRIWTKGRKQAPLALVIYLIFIIIGLVINYFVLMQIWPVEDARIFMFPAIVGVFIIGLSMLVKVVWAERNIAMQRAFKHPFLNKCNELIASRFNLIAWVVILLLPFFLLLTMILILFGQDYDSLVKVFTETTTWTFSQKSHPPEIPYEASGHYLCTVAAQGSPKIVKPYAEGVRRGLPILVNRQLQVANAFEELVYERCPRLHYIIRTNYDKYGYALAKQVHKTWVANLVYYLMKPLEWLFLLCLYLFVEQPEAKIKEQYMPSSH